MADQSKASAGTSASSPLSASDEREIASLFREHYDTLLAQSGEALGGDLAHFSGKVSQSAMLATWGRRAEFATPASFGAALREAVVAEAATQRRKHAALHQRESSAPRAPHVAVPTADEALAQLIATLKAPAVDHEAAASEARAMRKHHAAEHVQKVGKKASWKVPLALVIVLGAAIYGGTRWVATAGKESAVRRALAAEDARTLSASRGQRGNVDLADGTKARIGSDSKLRMPKEFGTTMRTAEVEGTVSFTVAPGQPLPFVVWAGNAVVTATGTNFAVRAFPEEGAVVVGVSEGSVTVRGKESSDETAVAAGQAARVAPDGTVSMLDAAASDVALAWVRDSLVLVNAPAGTALAELTRWFALSASLADSALGTRPVSMRLGLESSGDAIAAFARAADFVIGFDKDDKVVLSAAPPSAAKKK